MPPVVTVYWSKGGVGKTTVVQLLALFLAGIGLRVVIVDLDTQGGQSAAWDALDPETGKGYDVLHLVLRGRLKAAHALTTLSSDVLPRFKGHELGSVALIEGGPNTPVAIEEVLRNPVTYNTRADRLFSDVFADLDGIADLVIVDMGPSNQVTALAALNATDYLLLPTTMDLMSAQRADPVFDEITAAWEDNPDLQVLGILPTMTMYYFGGLRTSPNVKAGREFLEAAYGEFLLKDRKGSYLEIPYSEDYTRARWAGTNILTDGSMTRPATANAIHVMRELAHRMGIEIPEVHYA